MKVYVAVGVSKSERRNIDVGLSREAVVSRLDRLNRTIHHVVGVVNYGTGKVEKVDSWMAYINKSMVTDETAVSHIGVTKRGTYRMMAPDGSIVNDYMGNEQAGYYKYVEIEEWEVDEGDVFYLPKIDLDDHVRGHYDVWE